MQLERERHPFIFMGLAKSFTRGTGKGLGVRLGIRLGLSQSRERLRKRGL